MRDLFFDELSRLSPNILVSKWIIERTPHIFGSDVLQYIHWKRQLADAIGVDPCAIVLTGSSSVGISLNPAKNFRNFDAGPKKSDIDVAVVSSFHFEIAWRYLRNLGSKRYRLSQAAQASLKNTAPITFTSARLPRTESSNTYRLGRNGSAVFRECKGWTRHKSGRSPSEALLQFDLLQGLPTE